MLNLDENATSLQLGVDAPELADEEPEDGELDIHDLEFRMRSDLEGLTREASIEPTAREQWTVKVILCAGLYPQFAISDPANFARPQMEYQFSTRQRDGINIHPSSACAKANNDMATGSAEVVARVCE